LSRWFAPLATSATRCICNTYIHWIYHVI
jgi:hypothetical protein